MKLSFFLLLLSVVMLALLINTAVGKDKDKGRSKKCVYNCHDCATLCQSDNKCRVENRKVKECTCNIGLFRNHKFKDCRSGSSSILKLGSAMLIILMTMSSVSSAVALSN